jgi:predicted O-methyltransferase YrrM
MSQQLWSAMDAYITDTIAPEDEGLAHALSASEEAGLPPISVTAAQGKLLMLLAQLGGAQRILEVGTLGGYSTIWLGRALPTHGVLITLELDPHHAEVATHNLERAGLASICEVRVGSAHASLAALEAEDTAPFDLVFIDADKQSNPDYFASALRLTRPGSLIIVDNVVRGGAVLDAHSEDVAVVGIRKLYDMIAAEPRVHATALQTVGAKGYDGFIVARVVG